MAKAGRIAKTAEIAAEPSVDINKIDGAMDALRDQAQEDDATVFKVGQQVGALQATRMWRTAFRAAELKMFAELRALPMETVRKIPIQVDGALRRAERVPEFCELVFGRSYSKLAEEAQNLEAMGEEAYDIATSLGLNRSALRAARALPPESLEAVRLAITTGSSKADVLSVIEDLAEKIETAEKQVTDLQAENTASEELLSKRDATIKRLEREVNRFEKLPPDEKLLALQKDVADAMNDARGAVLGRMRQAVIALINAGDDRHAHDVFLAGLVGQVQAELAQLRAEFDLPDVSTAAEATLAAEVAQWAGKSN